MPVVQTQQLEGGPNPRSKIYVGEYNFAQDGGAVGTIALTGALGIPSGAFIVGGFIQVDTALTSGGAATIAVQVNSAGDIVPATAVATWTTGIKQIVPGYNPGGALAASTVFKTTADRDISAVIATAALTAGRFRVVLEYLDPLYP